MSCVSNKRLSGFEHTSETDTEVMAHEIARHFSQSGSLLEAVRTVSELRGAYAIGAIARDNPRRLVGARRGSPLVVGVGVGECFIASDVAALIPVTQQFVFLEEGDVVDIDGDQFVIYDESGATADRPIVTSDLSADAVERGTYRHYMLKEIHEQPSSLCKTPGRSYCRWTDPRCRVWS